MIIKKGLLVVVSVLFILLGMNLALGYVVINEFLADSPYPTDKLGEWVELYNHGVLPINISGWNITEKGASDNFTIQDITLAPNEFIVLAFNFTIFNSTYPSVNASGIRIIEYGSTVASFYLTNTDGDITLFNLSRELVYSRTYSSQQEDVSEGHYPDGTHNWYNFNIPTPGTANDYSPPILNTWINPSQNNEFINGSINITVNITDNVYSVDSAIVNFNSTNYSMENDSDIWHYLWHTDNNNDGSYDITVYYNDSIGYSNSSTLYNITVDNTFPSIDYASGTELNNTYFNRDWIYVNVTASDTNEQEITFYLFNSSIELINTTILPAGSRNINFTNLNPDMEYYYNVYISDKVNKVNNTKTRKITLDSTFPQVTYAGGTEDNDTFFNRDWVYVNVSVNETNFNNMTFYLYNSTSQLNASNFTVLTTAVNFTGLNSNEYYYYNATVRDKAGNVNSLETRNITLDSTNPSVTINSPINNINWSTAVSPTILNASVTDTNLQNVIFNVSNGISYLTYNAVLSGNEWVNTSFDTRNLAEGQHNLTVYAWDYASNLNNTESVTFTVDNYGPVFLTSKTPDPSYNNDSVTLNATVSDATSSVSDVWLSGNWSGSWQNYTFSGQPYSFTIGADNFTNQQSIGYQWFGNDTLNNIANSSFQSFIVENRAPLFNSSKNISDFSWVEDSGQGTVNLTKHFYDLDNDNLNYTAIVGNNNITVSINNNTGIVTLTSASNWNGATWVIFNAWDFVGANAQSNNVSISIQDDGNEPPILTSSLSPINFSEDLNITFNLICDPDDIGQNCTNYRYDPDYVSYDNNVTVTVNSLTGSVFMSNVQDWYGTTYVKFLADDDGTPILTDSVVVKVNITPVNDPPVINYSTGWNQTVNEDNGAWTLDLTPFEYDVDPEDTGTNLTWSIGNIDSSLINASLNTITDVISFTTIPNAHGINLLDINLTDSHNATTTGTLLVTINSVNDISFINGTIGPFTVFDDTLTSFDLTGLANDDNDTGTALLIWGVLNWDTSLWNFAGTGGGQSIFFNPKQIVGVNNITDTITVIVKDPDGGNDTISANVKLVPVNDAPSQVTLTSPANNSNQTAATHQVTLKWQNSTDPENQSLTYYIFLGNESNQPLNSSTLLDQYTISNLADNITYYWYVIANDGVNNATKSETWIFNTIFDHAPGITFYQPSDTVTVQENKSIIFNATVYDLDNDTISYNWTVDNILNSSGTTTTNNETVSFNYTPSFGDEGTRTVQLNIKDIKNNTGLPQSWTVTVTNNNRAPVLSAIANQPINEDSTLSFNITASDPDLAYGDSLTYSSNLSIININKINNTLATITWTPTNDNVGDNSVEFTVSDGGLSDSQTITITVTNTNDAPILTPIGSLTAYEDTIFTYDIDATDIDAGDNLTFYDNTTLFDINSTTGIINFTPSESDIGTYYINITVEDTSNETDSEIITLTISNMNDAPVLGSITNYSVLEDSTISFNITASDPDLIYGDSLTYTSNITIINIQKINNTFASVTWTPTNDYVGNNTINFTVTDSGSLSSSQLATITVVNTNDAPVISNYHPAFNPKIADITGSQLFNITAIDVDIGDSLTTTWYLNWTNESSGISYTATSLPAEDYSITAVVTDGNISVSHSWNLTVSDVPLSDKYTGTFKQLNSSQLDNASEITIELPSIGKIDFGNNTLNLSDTVDLDNYINISNGVIGIDTTKLPALNKPAFIIMEGLTYTLTPIIYYDSGFGVTGNTICPSTICTNIVYDSSSGILTFNVEHFSTYWSGPNTTNRAPVITSSPATTALANQTYSYDVEAEDLDNDILSYSLTTYPLGMSINNATGLITWTPTNTGSFNVVVIVSDGELTDSQSFTITVSEEEKPKLAITDLDVKINGESDTNLRNNDKISDPVNPDSTIEFRIKVENKYSDSEDIEIEDISIEIIIENIDDGDDLEEESDEFDLKAEDSQKETLSFDIPLKVEEDDYNVRIIVEGEDEDNNFHRIEWRLILEVEKENHNIIIREADIIPGIIKCEREVGFNIEIMNIGKKDEDDVNIKITNRDLDLDITETGIELDKDPDDDDNSFEKTYYIDLPEELDAKTYPVVYRVYYDSKLADTETEELIVTKCKETVTAKKEESVIVKRAGLVTKPTITYTGAAIAQPITAEPSVISITEPGDLVLILAVLFTFLCIIVLMLVILTILLRRSRKRR